MSHTDTECTAAGVTIRVIVGVLEAHAQLSTVGGVEALNKLKKAIQELEKSADNNRFCEIINAYH